METIGDENEALKESIVSRLVYTYFSNAQYVLNRAVADGYEGNIVYKDPYYAVQIGEYSAWWSSKIGKWIEEKAMIHLLLKEWS